MKVVKTLGGDEGGGFARWRRQRRRAGVVAAVVLALALIVPRRAAEGHRSIAPAEAEVLTCRLGSPCPDPGPAGWAARIESILEARAPRMRENTRRRVARAVVEEATRARLDPLLVAAVISIESGFDARAQSNRGARGLMQLRPSTMAREATRGGVAAGDPDDPVVNVRLGVRYLHRLVAAFPSIDHALMAYNAGPNRIADFLREGTVPDRFHTYPSRVKSEQRRLRRGFGLEPAPALADAGSPAPAY